MVSRRAALLSVAALAVTTSARAQGATIGDIKVDLSPLRAHWDASTLAVVDSNLRSGLRSAFADRIGRGGATLLVRISSISLSSSGGGGGFGQSGGGGGFQTDYMNGDIMLIGPGNAILFSEPLLSATANTSSWWDTSAETRRIGAMASNYAQWVRRKLG